MPWGSGDMVDAICLHELSEYHTGETGPIVRDHHLWQPKLAETFPQTVNGDSRSSFDEWVGVDRLGVGINDQ